MIADLAAREDPCRRRRATRRVRKSTDTAKTDALTPGRGPSVLLGTLTSSAKIRAGERRRAGGM
jgi:hypothetical protein